MGVSATKSSRDQRLAKHRRARARRSGFCSAASRRWATGEQAPTAILACRIRPSTTSSATATMTMEMTRYLRAPSFRKVERIVGGAAGQKTATSISSGARAVRRDPCRNCSSGSRRRPAPDNEFDFGVERSAAAERRRRRARRCTGCRRWWRGSGWTAPISRAAACKRGEGRRQVGIDDRVPGRRRAEANASAFAADAAKFWNPSDVDEIALQRPLARCGIKVGAARDRRGRRPRAGGALRQGERAERTPQLPERGLFVYK